MEYILDRQIPRDVRSILIHSGRLLSDDLKNLNILDSHVVSFYLLFSKGIPFCNQGAFILFDTNFICHFSVFYLFLISFTVAWLRPLMFPVFLVLGNRCIFALDTASLSIIPAFPAFNFPPSTKREHTDGTGNLAASSCCPSEFLSNTDQ